MLIKLEHYSELVEIGLIASAQTKNSFKLIELRLITLTQIENDSELIELNLVTLTQIKFYVEPVSNFPSHYRISNGETYCNILFSLCLFSNYFPLDELVLKHALVILFAFKSLFAKKSLQHPNCFI